VNRFPWSEVFMLIAFTLMMTFGIVTGSAFAGAVWGVAVGLQLSHLIEDLFYWKVKKESGQYESH